uniref:Uncharacterized protein n=1 Tax=Arundo donax TaxID=35708 RepID=A0A0A9FV71_ARUDO
MDGAVGEEGAEEGADDALRLVGAAHVAVADVEDYDRLHPRGGRRGGRREEESGGCRHGLSRQRGSLVGGGGEGRRGSPWAAAQQRMVG